MGRVLELAQRHGLFVVEDCAVALGATIDGTHVGLLGDIGCFSFYPVKHITTGEGGMVITRHDDVADSVGKQRAFGIDRSVLADRRHTGAYEIERLGLNYRLGEVGAAIGVEQLRRLPEFLEVRERNFDRSAGRLSGRRGPAGARDGSRRRTHVIALLPERGARRRAGEQRERIIDELKLRGIGTSVYYPKSLPDTLYYRETYGFGEGSCPGATRISTRSIAFPVGPHLQEGDIDFMITNVRDVLAEVR